VVELGNDQNAVYEQKCDEKNLKHNHKRHIDNSNNESCVLVKNETSSSAIAERPPGWVG